MNQSSYELSIEELAFAMGVLGGSDAAAGFLLAFLGERSKDEMDGRLLAAGHSLLARKYLDLDMESQEKRLVESLAGMVHTLLANDFSIRLSRSALGQEQVLTYFLHEARLIEHRTRQAVVSQLETIHTADAVLDRSCDFFNLPTAPDTADEENSVGTISFEILEQAKDRKPGTAGDSISSILTRGNLTAGVAEEMAEDFAALEYRGSVIRIENREGQVLSGEGFLLLKSPDRFWIFEIIPQDPALARVVRGTPERFRVCLQSLLDKPAQPVQGSVLE